MQKSYRNRETMTIKSNSIDTTTSGTQKGERQGVRKGGGGWMVDGESHPMTRRKYLAADGE